MPAKEFREEWGIEQDEADRTPPNLWILGVADIVRIVGDKNAGDIRAEWEATYNSDGDFTGWQRR